MDIIERHTAMGIGYENFKKLKCCYCEKILSEREITKDHLIPKRRGGVGAICKKPCCKKCNTEKGDMYLEEYLLYLIGFNKTSLLSCKIRNVKKWILYVRKCGDCLYKKNTNFYDYYMNKFKDFDYNKYGIDIPNQLQS